MLTAQEIARACKARLADAERFAEPLNEAMARFEINNARRQAAFLATAAIESAHLATTRENLNYRDAARLVSIYPRAFKTVADATPFVRNPEALGQKLYSGYYGRGLIQLTWVANYVAAGDALGYDYASYPAMVEEPKHAALTAAWFWHDRGCNALADLGDMNEITRRVNGPAPHAPRRAHGTHPGDADVVGLKVFDLVPGWVYAAALGACLLLLGGQTIRAAGLRADLAEAKASAADLGVRLAGAVLQHEQEKALLVKEHGLKLSQAEKTHAEKLAAVEVRARADAATAARLRKQIADYASRGGEACGTPAAVADGRESAAQVLGGLLAESLDLLAESRTLHELRDAEVSLLFEQIDADRAACSGSIRPRVDTRRETDG